MAADSIRVIAQAVAKPDCLEAIRHLVKPLAEATRDDPACVRYELWFSLDRKQSFVIYQEWDSMDALEAHIHSELVEELGYRLGELVAGPPIVHRYQVAV